MTPAALSALLYAHDPIGLVSAGCPPDEYDSEAGTILWTLGEAVDIASLQTIIHEEFVYWFTARVAGPPERYEDLAKALWEAKDIQGG